MQEIKIKDHNAAGFHSLVDSLVEVSGEAFSRLNIQSHSLVGARSGPVHIITDLT